MLMIMSVTEFQDKVNGEGWEESEAWFFWPDKCGESVANSRDLRNKAIF